MVVFAIERASFMNEQRVVCLNCIDGRIQLPVIHWIKENYAVDYVDMITAPGMDGLMANAENSIEETTQNIRLSISSNQAQMIFIVGHHDCRGNPASEAEHKKQILLAVARLSREFISLPVKGIWINKSWNGELLELDC